MTASERPKRPGRPRKPPVARALRRVRNKDLPGHCESSSPWHPTTEAGRIELAIDASLVEAQKTIKTMVTNAVHHDRCDHMAIYMLELLVGRASTLTRRQRESEQADVP